MVPSESARLRWPGREEGEGRRAERNRGRLGSGRKLGGVGTNRGGGEGPSMLAYGEGRPGLVGKRPAASPGRNLQESRGAGERKVSPLFINF